MQSFSNKTTSESLYRALNRNGKSIWLGVFVILVLVGSTLGLAIWLSKQSKQELSQSMDKVYLLFHQNKLDEALAQTEDLLNIYPDHSAILATKALILAQKGSLSFEEKELGTQAVSVAKQAVEADPQNSEAYRILGYAYEIQEEYNLAHQNYAQAIQLNPKNAQALFGDAHVYDLQGDLAKAEKGYQQSLEFNSSFDQAYLGMARVLVARGDEKGAVESLEKALAVSTNVHNKAEITYSIARLSLNMQDIPKGLSYGEQSTLLDPNYPLGWYAHATALFLDSFNKTKYPEAATRGAFITQSIGELRKALILNPNQSVVYLQLGIEFSAINKHEDALESFRRGLLAVPKDITLNADDKVLMMKKIEDAQKLAIAMSKIRGGNTAKQ
jgi:tetratricopeptide (TPR) repeat protein